jgi:DNA transformation protein
LAVRRVAKDKPKAGERRRDPFVDGLVAALTPLGPVHARAMFGGWGVYLDGLCFGLVAGTALFLKVNDANRPDYERAGMGPFKPWEDKPVVLASYYEVPAKVARAPATLRTWAEKAIEAARGAKAAKRQKRQKR